MLKHTDLVVALHDTESRRLVGFARLLTDFVYRATLYDVIVHPEQRSTGLGRWLMEAVVNHPRLQKVNVVWLCCLPEMAAFYERWGFTTNLDGIQWMRTDPRNAQVSAQFFSN